MLYLFIAGLLAIGVNSQTTCEDNAADLGCEDLGMICVEYSLAGFTTAVCGCDSTDDCDLSALIAGNAGYAALGDFTLACYDFTEATTGIASGYKSCAPQYCSSSTDCDDGVECTGNYCISVDIDTGDIDTCDQSFCEAAGLTCVDYTSGGVTVSTCGCTSADMCDDGEVCVDYSSTGIGQCITSSDGCDPECESDEECISGNTCESTDVAPASGEDAANEINIFITIITMFIAALFN